MPRVNIYAAVFRVVAKGCTHGEDCISFYFWIRDRRTGEGTNGEGPVWPIRTNA